MSRRVALFGLFGSGNLGNDASLVAMVESLRARCPDVELTVLCQEPARVGALTGLPALRITARGTSPLAGRRFLRPIVALTSRLLDVPYAVRRVRSFDVVVVPGMGVLEERLGARPWGMPWMLGVWSAAAALRRVPFALVSVGADEAENPWTRRLFSATVRRARYCSFRDDFSCAAVVAMGASDPGPIFPDLAFALPAPARAAVASGAGDAGNTVAVGVLDWYGANDDRVNGRGIHEKYVRDIAELVLAIAQQGHHVRMVVGDAVDAATAEEIRSRFAEAYPQFSALVIEEPPATTFEELCGQLASCSVVVASRYHNLVAALLLHKPVVSFGYGPKNDALLDGFGLLAFGQQLDDFDVTRARRQLCDAFSRRQEISAAVSTQLETCQLELDRQFADVAAFVEAS